MSELRRRHEVNGLIHLVNRQGKGFLKEEVEKAKLDEALAIMRAGAGRQVAYLVERIGFRKLEKLVQAKLERHVTSGSLADKARKTGNVSSLIQLLYNQKQAEADVLAAGKLEDLLAYLLRSVELDALRSCCGDHRP